MINKKVFIVFLNCTILFLVGTFCVSGQKNMSDLENKRVTIKMKDKPLRAVLGYLIVNYDVAVGFEESTLDSVHNDYDFIINQPFADPSRKRYISGFTPIKQHWFTIDAENERLEDILNIIVGQMQNYKWEITDDVVNIFPSQGRDKRYEELLNLKIGDFTLKKPAPILMIRTKLFTLPEVISFLKEIKINSSFNRSDFNFNNRKLGVELNFSNLTFRELLNKITKIKRGGWIIKKDDVHGSEEKEYIDIQI